MSRYTARQVFETDGFFIFKGNNPSKPSFDQGCLLFAEATSCNEALAKIHGIGGTPNQVIR
ncbi:MAG: hypothetical protein E2O83_09105 [Bacteroidetes bacterium]|nr:MAG: hypothetical protein E2O83_09105 [Bacteroidota bacterium]